MAASWIVRSDYRHFLGSHVLTIAIRSANAADETAVACHEAWFVLAEVGPLLAIGYRFGASMPWCWTAPFNWHFTPATERVVPPRIALTPQSRAKHWGTLWISLVDADDGRVLVRRAVALRPEFTRALHEVLRTQALRPFQGAAADRALGLYHTATQSPTPRVRAWSRSAGGSAPWARPRRAIRMKRIEQAS